MKETRMYHKMRDKLTVKGTLIQRIEMDHVPDIFYRTWHRDGWIELKVLDQYREQNHIPWRPGQMNWIRSYRTLNGNIFLFLYCDDKLWIFKGLGIQEHYYKSEMLKHASYISTSWKNTNWEQVYEILDH